MYIICVLLDVSYRRPNTSPYFYIVHSVHYAIIKSLATPTNPQFYNLRYNFYHLAPICFGVVAISRERSPAIHYCWCTLPAEGSYAVTGRSYVIEYLECRTVRFLVLPWVLNFFVLLIICAVAKAVREICKYCITLLYAVPILAYQAFNFHYTCKFYFINMSSYLYLS